MVRAERLLPDRQRALVEGLCAKIWVTPISLKLLSASNEADIKDKGWQQSQKGIQQTKDTISEGVLESPYVAEDKKEALKRQYEELNPAELHRQIQRLQNRLYEMVMLKEEVRKIKKVKPISHRKSESCYTFV